MPSLRVSPTLLFALTLSLAATAAAQPLSQGVIGPEFIPLATPCRALDTRVTGTPLAANVPTPIQIGGVTTGGANCGANRGTNARAGPTRPYRNRTPPLPHPQDWPGAPSLL